MLQFERLEFDVGQWAVQFKETRLFEHIVIDEFCDEETLLRRHDQISDPITENINKNRDYRFANNKYEKSGLKDLSPFFAEMYTA